MHNYKKLILQINRFQSNITKQSITRPLEAINHHLAQLACGHRFSLYEKYPTFPPSLSLFLFPNTTVPGTHASARLRNTAARTFLACGRRGSSTKPAPVARKTKGAVASRASRTHVNAPAIKPCLALAPTRFVRRRLASNRSSPPVDLTTGKYSQKRRADLFPLETAASPFFPGICTYVVRGYNVDGENPSRPRNNGSTDDKLGQLFARGAEKKVPLPSLPSEPFLRMIERRSRGRVTFPRAWHFCPGMCRGCDRSILCVAV